MVLLEECIMSVMRVAAFLDVNIPWLKSDLLTTHVSKLGDCFSTSMAGGVKRCKISITTCCI